MSDNIYLNTTLIIEDLSWGLGNIITSITASPNILTTIALTLILTITKGINEGFCTQAQHYAANLCQD